MDNNLTPSLNNKEAKPIKATKPNAVGRFFKYVFIKDIGYKILAIALSTALWLIVVGFGG